MITAEGFKRKRYADYLPEVEAEIKGLFGADIDLSDESPFGKLAKLFAYQRAEANELAEQVYNSNHVDTAEGVQLDKAVKAKLITRFSALAAYGFITINCEPGTTVESGFIGSTTDDIQFFTTAAVTDTDNDGVVIAPIEAVEFGTIGNVEANTITVITTPTAGVTSISNPARTVGGRNKETDAELRERYYNTTGDAATPDGLRTKLMNDVLGVRAAVVIENDNDEPDTDGRPAHSFEAIVLGGEAPDIAAAILSNKPGGIQAYGSESVMVKDLSGNDKSIGFSYATEIDIFVNVYVKISPAFPTNGADMIKLDIIKYIGGQAADGSFYAGLGMGDNVIEARASNAVFRTEGVEDVTVELSTDGMNYNSGNIEIGKTEVAQTDYNKVVINFV